MCIANPAHFQEVTFLLGRIVFSAKAKSDSDFMQIVQLKNKNTGVL